MSAAWPWVILGRVAHAVPLPKDAAGAAAAEEEDDDAAADFTIRVAQPPEATVLTVAPLVHPFPNFPDKYPYIIAAGPDCRLLNFAVHPYCGVDSPTSSRECFLTVARRFRTGGVRQGHARALVTDRIPVRRRRDVAIPVAYSIKSIGLVASYDGDFTLAELAFDHGAEYAKLYRFFAGCDSWTVTFLLCPLPLKEIFRKWVLAGVVAQKETLWWFDLSWGLLSGDACADDPVLVFHRLPEDRVLDEAGYDIHTHRCVTVSRHELRYVEIIPGEGGGDCDDKEAATVSMWTRRVAATPDGWEWDKNYAVSFEEIWNDDTYKDTRLPRKVPVLSTVCPTNPDLVYFSLERRFFGVVVPKHKVVKVADEPHVLVNLPLVAALGSCRYVHAWNLPPWVAKDLDLVGFSSSYEDEEQEEEPDKEELFKLGLEAVMRMDPATLKSEVDKYGKSFECGFPSPEREVMMDLRAKRAPADFFRLTDKQAEEQLRKLRRIIGHTKKRRRDE